MKSKMIVLFLLVHTLVYGQADSTDLIVQKMMKDQKITGLSLAVIKNGNPIVNKGYGLANVEHNVPVTAETVIRLGSLSKQFFSTAILKLKEEGKKTNPDPDILEIIQDKALQKQVYVQHDIPTSSFILFHNKEEIISAVANKKLKFLLVQKLRKGGYDGKAVAVIKNKNDLMLSILQMLS